MNNPFRSVLGLSFAVLTGILPGCSFTGAGPITARSVNSTGSLVLEPTLRAYRAIDSNTADVYLTDLPAWALEPGASLAEVSGQLLHLHLFISPEAGQTPIDQTACSVTLRQFVIARGQIGMYGGGGFLQPDDDPGDGDFDGAIRGATMRFISSTPGFSDLLGPAELSGGIEAPRDDQTARMLAAKLNELMSTIGRQPAGEPPAKPAAPRK